MKLTLSPLIFIMSLFVSLSSYSQTAEEFKVADNYTKQEVEITMRDGIKLHTTVYSPKDTSKKYPIIMQRTPYSSQPYGEDQFRSRLVLTSF